MDFKYTTDKIYELNKINRGLGGILLEERNVKKFTRSFSKKLSKWTKEVDKSNWVMYIAKDNNS